MKIKTDKAKLEVIFKCKSVNEMNYVLDTFIKSNEVIIEETKKALE